MLKLTSTISEALRALINQDKEQEQKKREVPQLFRVKEIY